MACGVTEVVTNCNNRRLFATKRGRIGLGPPDLQVGDKICAFIGSSRLAPPPPSPETFRLIGDAYVHGLIYGEAFTTEGRGPKQRFVLVWPWHASGNGIVKRRHHSMSSHPSYSEDCIQICDLTPYPRSRSSVERGQVGMPLTLTTITEKNEYGSIDLPKPKTLVTMLYSSDPRPKRMIKKSINCKSTCNQSVIGYYHRIYLFQ